MVGAVVCRDGEAVVARVLEEVHDAVDGLDLPYGRDVLGHDLGRTQRLHEGGEGRKRKKKKEKGRGGRGS